MRFRVSFLGISSVSSSDNVFVSCQTKATDSLETGPAGREGDQGSLTIGGPAEAASSSRLLLGLLQYSSSPSERTLLGGAGSGKTKKNQMEERGWLTGYFKDMAKKSGPDALLRGWQHTIDSVRHSSACAVAVPTDSCLFIFVSPLKKKKRKRNEMRDPFDPAEGIGYGL